MGITAIAGIAGSLISKLESLHSHKAAKAGSTGVSDPGMLFSQLQNLSQQNPTEFQKITAQVAQQLQTASTAAAAATSATSPQTSVLNQMASNFQHASQTGSFSDLFVHAPQTATQQAATATPSGQLYQHYAYSMGAADSAVHSIFSQALAQINVDQNHVDQTKVNLHPTTTLTA